MQREEITVCGKNVTVYTVRAAVVGAGAAGYGAALSLYRQGVTDVLLLAEDLNCGTSRNAGSDKQTYYKLDMSGGADSMADMAQALMAGGAMDGDTALAEAAGSVRGFLRLCELGVPFPTDRYGQYIGYKTDHDPLARGSSAGPLTSHMMTVQLEKAVQAAGIPLLDGLMAVEILKCNDRAAGILCLKVPVADEAEFVLIRAGSTVWCTGGPAGIYKHTVFPVGHTGGSGPAYLAGVWGQNLTEWQYGLASLHPRWNVSGTYMQVLPRVYSVDERGVEREFLTDTIPHIPTALSLLFQKGYQWPFDCRRAETGSSQIDLAVYGQQLLGRRVYLDYRKNPFGLGNIPYAELTDEAREYLQTNGACFGTPIDRLQHMNAPAVDFYRRRGVDLYREPLEIGLCAQHSNGGIAVDAWWQTSLPGLYAAGEAAGTHGVTRPGGSALNAGQVGGLRAAQHIAYKGNAPADMADFAPIGEAAVQKHTELCRLWMGGEDTVTPMTESARSRMSAMAGAIREGTQLPAAAAESTENLRTIDEKIKVDTPDKLPDAYRLRDLAVCQAVYLAAMADYAAVCGVSRGSALYRDTLLRCDRRDQIQQARLTAAGVELLWRPVRPMVPETEPFESCWRRFREDGNVY